MAHGGHTGSAGYSGRCAPDTPVSGSLFVDLAKIPPKFLKSVGKLARLAARNAIGLGAITQITKSLDQNHKKLTQTRDRSETKFGVFYENFRFLGDPWQPKATDTNMLRGDREGGPMFKDSWVNS